MTTAADYPGPLPATVVVLDGDHRPEYYLDGVEPGADALALVTKPAPIDAGAGDCLSPKLR